MWPGYWFLVFESNFVGEPYLEEYNQALIGMTVNAFYFRECTYDNIGALGLPYASFLVGFLGCK